LDGVTVLNSLTNSGGTLTEASTSGSGATPATAISPNPFNATTAISFELQAASYVSLQVYDTSGRMVATLVEGWEAAGTHEVTFDGSKLVSGIYLVNLQAGNVSGVQKIVLLK
jgi:hypothetical protein